jgi:hypothetical protein
MSGIIFLNKLEIKLNASFVEKIMLVSSRRQEDAVQEDAENYVIFKIIINK